MNAFEYIKFLNLNQILEDFLEDPWKTLGRLPGKSSNGFYVRRRPTKSSGSHPKFEYADFSDMTLEDFSEDSWKNLRNSQKTIGRLRNSQKTLGRLLEKSSNVFYARRLPTMSSGSLPKSFVQSGKKE